MNALTDAVIGVVIALFLFAVVVTLVTDTDWYKERIENSSLETLLLITFPTLIVVGGVMYVIHNIKGRGR